MKYESEVKEKFTNIIQNFIDGNDEKFELSPNLNPNERRLIHEVAEELNIFHESEGVGRERHIVLKKKASSSSQTLSQKSTELSEKSSKKENVKPNVINTPTEPTVTHQTKNINIVTCSTCQKEMPKANIELHKLRCSVPKPVLVDNREKKPQKKKKDKKPKDSKESTEDDFDALCEEFQKMKNVCNFSAGCKTKVSVIGVDCVFCRVRFCLSHSMAELHGCGPAAKAAARKQLTADQKLYPGSGRPSNAMDPTKRAHIKRNLDKKLTGLADSRTKKSSSESKK